MSSEMMFKCTGWICETSSSDSHSGQLRISPSSTSSSSTSISAEHSGQRITAPSSVRVSKVGAAKTASTTVERIIYRREVNPMQAGSAGFAILQKTDIQLINGVFAGVSRTADGRSGWRDYRAGARAVDSTRQRAAAWGMVDSRRNAGVGRDAGGGRSARIAGRNRSHSTRGRAYRSLRPDLRGERRGGEQGEEASTIPLCDR